LIHSVKLSTGGNRKPSRPNGITACPIGTWWTASFSDFPTLFPPYVNVRRLICDEVPYDYDQLDDIALTHSIIKSEFVSALSEIRGREPGSGIPSPKT
jgi:hypothetical protein